MTNPGKGAILNHTPQGFRMPVLQPSKPGPLDNAFNALIRRPAASLRPKPPKPAPTPARDPLTKNEADQALELVRAIERKDLKIVDQLLKSGTKPFVRTPDGRLPLVEAAIAGNISVTMRLVEAGADPRDADGLGRTALGVVWLQANGGPDLDPSIAPKMTGQAGRLLTQWQQAFPVRNNMDDYFSVDFRHNHMSAPQAARLDLEPSLRVAFSDQANFAGGSLPWEQVTSVKTLQQRQHERRARVAVAPEKTPELLPLPTHSKSIY